MTELVLALAGIASAAVLFRNWPQVEVNTACCMRCGDLYEDGTEHVCPSFIVEVECMDCDGISRADRLGRCLTCSSVAVRHIRTYRINERGAA